MLSKYKRNRRREKLPKSVQKVYTNNSLISEKSELIPLPNYKKSKKTRSYSRNRQIRFKELCIGNEKFREELYRVQMNINEKYAKVRKLKERRNRLDEIIKGVEKPKSMRKKSKKFDQKRLNLVEENEFLKAKLHRLKVEKLKKRRFRLHSSNENVKNYEMLKEKFEEIVRLGLAKGWLQSQSNNLGEDQKIVKRILTDVGEKYNFKKKKGAQKL